MKAYGTNEDLECVGASYGDSGRLNVLVGADVNVLDYVVNCTLLYQSQTLCSSHFKD
jgi:hypothetical protein